MYSVQDATVNTVASCTEYIGAGRQLREVNHLST
jgi:hypothetical protein